MRQVFRFKATMAGKHCARSLRQVFEDALLGHREHQLNAEWEAQPSGNLMSRAR